MDNEKILCLSACDILDKSTSRLVRLPEVMSRVGLSRSSIYKRMAEGAFPKNRSLGAKCAVWVEAEIDIWIEQVSNSAHDY